MVATQRAPRPKTVDSAAFHVFHGVSRPPHRSGRLPRDVSRRVSRRPIGGADTAAWTQKRPERQSRPGAELHFAHSTPCERPCQYGNETFSANSWWSWDKEGVAHLDDRTRTIIIRATAARRDEACGSDRRSARRPLLTGCGETAGRNHVRDRARDQRLQKRQRNGLAAGVRLRALIGEPSLASGSPAS
jgi:hypothetical protein